MYVRGYLQGSENGRVVTIEQMTAYRKFRKLNTGIGFRNRLRLFPVLPIVKKKKKLKPTDRP
jgi:hypothetical protein